MVRYIKIYNYQYHIMDTYFDKIYIINLKESTDRKKMIDEQMALIIMYLNRLYYYKHFSYIKPLP